MFEPILFGFCFKKHINLIDKKSKLCIPNDLLE